MNMYCIGNTYKRMRIRKKKGAKHEDCANALKLSQVAKLNFSSTLAKRNSLRLEGQINREGRIQKQNKHPLF